MLGFLKSVPKECEHDWVKIGECCYFKLFEESIDEYGFPQRECIKYTRSSEEAWGWRYEEGAIRFDHVWEQAKQVVCLKCKAIINEEMLWQEEERMITMKDEAEVERYKLRYEQAQEIWDKENYEGNN